MTLGHVALATTCSIVLLTCAAPAQAQWPSAAPMATARVAAPTPVPSAQAPDLRPGASVRVLLDDFSIVQGQVVDAGPDALVIDAMGRRLTIPSRRIRGVQSVAVSHQMDQATRDKIGAGFAIGGAIGFGVVRAIRASSDNHTHPSDLAGVAIGAAVGGMFAAIAYGPRPTLRTRAGAWQLAPAVTLKSAGVAGWIRW